MRRIGLGVLAIAVVLLTNNLTFAQAGTTGREIKKADINLRELAAYERAHPQPLVRQEPMEEDADEDHRVWHPNTPALVHLHRPPLNRGANGPSGALLPVSIAPSDSFLAAISPGTMIPPDTHGAVDSQYCVTAINTGMTIQDRVGNTIDMIGLSTFWSSVLPAGTVAFDPRIHYDPYQRKWILVTDAVVTLTHDHSTLLVGVSVTNDPLGAWHLYAIDVDPSGTSWMDFPNVGYNNKWIVVTGNMFNGASGAVIYVIDYASMRAGTGAPYSQFSQPSSFTIAPALTYDATEPNMFMLEAWSGNNGQLKLWKITGPVSAPVLSTIGLPATTQHWHGSGGGTNFAAQLGTTNKVDAGDDRITSVVFKNKKLWCAHAAFLPSPGTATRSGVMWWQIDTLANPIQVGLVNGSPTPSFLFNPSIAVNDSNDALIGFSYLNSTVYPSSGYALRIHSDPIDSTRPARIFRHGQATYYTLFSGTRNRWGDYSATCIDPRNNMDFWTIQEASTTGGTSANWDTWWANVQFCPKPSQPTMLFTGAPCAGDTCSFAIASIPGATAYHWYVSGTGWSGTSTSTTLHALAGTGVGTIVAVAYNSCGQGESRTLHITPNVVPAAPFVNVYEAPCTGVSTAIFTAIGSFGFNWSVVGTGWSGTGAGSVFNTTVGTGTALIICSATNSCGTGPADTMIVNPGTPVVSFTESASITNINTGVVVTPTVAAPAGSTFTWNFGGGTATPGTGSGPQTVQWATPGLKSVSFTADNLGCSANFTDTVRVRDLTGVVQVKNAAYDFSLLPNPSAGQFDVIFTKPLNVPVAIRIADMYGKAVYYNEFAGAGTDRLTVSAMNVATGNYTVTVSIDGETSTKKITINR